VGYSLAAYGASAVVIQAGVLRWIAARIETRGAAALGLGMLVIGFIGFAFGRGPWVVATCVPLTAMGFMAGPALTSLLSADIAADAQGTLQGVLASINGVAAVLTPLGMPWLFSVFSRGSLGIRFPGAPYILAAMLALVGLALVQRAESNRRQGILARTPNFPHKN
jgi:DHA1 family tetracycline resistance protein-like MFS transporter